MPMIYLSIQESDLFYKVPKDELKDKEDYGLFFLMRPPFAIFPYSLISID